MRKNWVYFWIIGIMILSFMLFMIVNRLVQYKQLETRLSQDQTQILTEQIKGLYLEQQAQEAKVKEIVEKIYTMDVFSKNIGGYEIPQDYNLDSVLGMIESQISNQDSMLVNAELFFATREKTFKGIPNIWPFNPSPSNKMTSPFGVRYSPFTNKAQQHTGIDLSSTWRAEILATADGSIQDHWIDHPVYGKHIIIDHGNGYKTMYAHLSVSYVHEGYFVEKGQVIGRMGNTGMSKGQHLHYEIRYNGEPINPIDFLKTYVKE